MLEYKTVQICGGMNKNKRYEEQNMPGQKEVTFNTEMKAQVTTKIRIHKSLKFLFYGIQCQQCYLFFPYKVAYIMGSELWLAFVSLRENSVFLLQWTALPVEI